MDLSLFGDDSGNDMDIIKETKFKRQEQKLTLPAQDVHSAIQISDFTDSNTLSKEDEHWKPKSLQVGISDLFTVPVSKRKRESSSEDDRVDSIKSTQIHPQEMSLPISEFVSHGDRLLSNNNSTDNIVPSTPVKETSQDAQILELTPQQKQEVIDSLLSRSRVEAIPRYFLTEEIVCRYCRKKGHIFRNCPESAELCHLCRAKHDPLSCPYGDVCFQCYRRGHQKSECPDFINRVPRYCSYCDIRGHSTMDCSRVWRKYIKRDSREVKNVKELNVWCYNCGSGDHFGDFCGKRNGYVAPSAFDFNRDDIDDYRRKARYANNGNRHNGQKNSKAQKLTPKFKSKPKYSGGYN
jgi:hypothetical protein